MSGNLKKKKNEVNKNSKRDREIKYSKQAA